MEELTDILTMATSAIPEDYFHFKIDGGDPIYRERVYCYELYHQMRMLWPKDSEYYLNGEIDKAAHPILRELGADFAKPDLLVHKPGYMTGNYSIIEVKTCNADFRGIKKDLYTLSTFINSVKYERAIYLIFGDDISEKLLSSILDEAVKYKTTPIELWLHEKPNIPAFQKVLLA